MYYQTIYSVYNFIVQAFSKIQINQAAQTMSGIL